MKALFKLLIVALSFGLVGCSGFNPNAVRQYGYPEEFSWTRSPAPPDAGPLCEGKMLKEVRDWVLKEGDTLEYHSGGSSCVIRTVAGDKNPNYQRRGRSVSSEANGPLTLSVLKERIKYTCRKGTRTEIREMYVTTSFEGWNVRVKGECFY